MPKVNQRSDLMKSFVLLNKKEFPLHQVTHRLVKEAKKLFYPGDTSLDQVVNRLNNIYMQVNK